MASALCKEIRFSTFSINLMTSLANNCGSSKAAKCPPRGISENCTMSTNRLWAKGAGIAKSSWGKSARPVGTAMGILQKRDRIVLRFWLRLRLRLRRKWKPGLTDRAGEVPAHPRRSARRSRVFGAWLVSLVSRISRACVYLSTVLSLMLTRHYLQAAFIVDCL